VEFLVVVLLLAVFLGPSAYHMYERYKRRKEGRGVPAKEGPSYLRHLLGMLAPVFVLIAFLTLLAVGLYLAGGRAGAPPLPGPTATPGSLG
jgi:ABC-type Fe3+ transport system permease subunit